MDQSIVTSAYDFSPPFHNCYLFQVCFLWVCIVCPNAYAIIHSMEAEPIYGVINHKIIVIWVYSNTFTKWSLLELLLIMVSTHIILLVVFAARTTPPFP